MKIRFLSSIIASGQHRDEGSIAEIEDREASSLIAQGLALCAATTPAIETAEAAPAAEKAARTGKQKSK